jgi:TRAP-type C4-dicarboxylate transport system substrate-binding protein
MAQSTGAVLMSKKFHDALPEDQKKILHDLSAKHLKRLNELSGVENASALDALKRQGLDLAADPGLATRRKYEDLGAAARGELAGKLFSSALLEKFEKELAALRARSVKKS